MTPNEIAKQLKQYCKEHNLKGKHLADKANVDQGQTSKILSGQFSTVSPNVRKLCKVANFDPDFHTSDPTEYEPFIEALAEVWDRTPQRRTALVKVIRSLKGLA